MGARSNRACAPIQVALLAATLSLAAPSCGGGGTLQPPVVPLTEPTALCSRAQPTHCRHPTQLAHMLRHAQLELLQSSETPGGTQGARVLTLKTNSTVFRAKWRPQASGDLINEPRKELAAYAVQQLLSKPLDYVVPPVAGRCFDIEPYRRAVDAAASATAVALRVRISVLLDDGCNGARGRA